MNRVLLLIMVAAILPSPCSGQGPEGSVLLPEVGWAAIQIDGFWGHEEWCNAQIVSVADPCELLLLRSGGYVYIGVKCPGVDVPMVDLFLRPKGGQTFQFHASGHFDERIVLEDGLKESRWGEEVGFDWTANRVRWSTPTRDSLVAMGVFGQEMLRQAVLPLEGFEFRFREDQISASAWALRIEVRSFATEEEPILLPPDTGNSGGQSWILVQLTGCAETN